MADEEKKCPSCQRTRCLFFFNPTSFADNKEILLASIDCQLACLLRTMKIDG